MNEIKSSAFPLLCRACLSQQQSIQLLSLFSTRNNISVNDMFVEVTSIQVFDNKRLPSSICIQCLQSLENAYDFKKLCHQSNKLLEKFCQDDVESELITSIKNEQNDLQCDVEPSDLLENSFELKLESDSINSPECDSVEMPIVKEDTDEPKAIVNINKRKKSKTTVKQRETQSENDKKCAQFTLLMKNGKVACTVCNKQFAYGHSFKRHFIRYHLNFIKDIDIQPVLIEPKIEDVQKQEADAQLKCPICPKEYRLFSSLRRHQSKHKHYSQEQVERRKQLLEEKRNERGKFSCNECDKEFCDRQTLRWHKLIHRNETFPCSLCDKKFNRKPLLQTHMRIHTGERQLTCHVCGKTFYRKSVLNSHVKIHLPAQYKCQICSRAFSTSKTLKMHIRTHTGERPHKCDVCQKTFNRKHILKTHYMTHTDDRPFACRVCPRAFRTKQHLNLHMNSHAT